MAYIVQYTNERARSAHPLQALRDAIVARWHRRRAYARTYAELNALSGRELADLGIDRTMIAQLAREAAYGK